MQQLLIILFLTFCPIIFAKEVRLEKHYEFASIQFLVEQEVGRIVLPAIYQNLGISIDVEPLPGKRAQYVANSGHHAGEIMRIWSYGDDNQNTIRVPTPYYYLETMAFVLKSSQIVINKQADLAKYRLTKVRGVKHTNNITVGLKNIYEMSNAEEMFKLLKNGKVDVVLTNTLDGNLALEKLKDTSIQPMTKPLAVLPLYHYIHKKHRDLVPVIDKEIRRLKANGKLAYLINNAEIEVLSRVK